MVAMRPSRVLETLRRGEPSFTMKLNLGNARGADLAAGYGFDCLWVCQEHVGTDWSSLEDLIRSAKMHNCDTMVRVAKGCYSDFIQPLELDAAGIMVPHVMNAGEAASIVRQCRFQPLGMRPLDGGNCDGQYCRIPIAEYARQANERRFLCLQIEDPEALEVVDEIAAVPGYDILFFGPGDFAHAIGKIGQLDCPEVRAARQRIAEAAIRHGKYAGTVGSVKNMQELLGLGYKFINLGADVSALNAYFRDIEQVLTTAFPARVQRKATCAQADSSSPYAR